MASRRAAPGPACPPRSPRPATPPPCPAARVPGHGRAGQRRVRKLTATAVSTAGRRHSRRQSAQASASAGDSRPGTGYACLYQSVWGRSVTRRAHAGRRRPDSRRVCRGAPVAAAQVRRRPADPPASSSARSSAGGSGSPVSPGASRRQAARRARTAWTPTLPVTRSRKPPSTPSMTLPVAIPTKRSSTPPAISPAPISARCQAQPGPARDAQLSVPARRVARRNPGWSAAWSSPAPARSCSGRLPGCHVGAYP